jgi:hypothetical protein
VHAQGDADLFAFRGAAMNNDKPSDSISEVADDLVDVASDGEGTVSAARVLRTLRQVLSATPARASCAGSEPSHPLPPPCHRRHVFGLRLDRPRPGDQTSERTQTCHRARATTADRRRRREDKRYEQLRPRSR